MAFATVVAVIALTACAGDDAPEREGVALPADFPSAQVPLVDGAIQSASGESPEWQVTVAAPATEGNAFENAVTRLTEASYAESSRSETDREKTVLMSKEVDGKTYWVTVGISASASASRTTVM